MVTKSNRNRSAHNGFVMPMEISDTKSIESVNSHCKIRFNIPPVNVLDTVQQKWELLLQKCGGLQSNLIKNINHYFRKHYLKSRKHNLSYRKYQYDSIKEIYEENIIVLKEANQALKTARQIEKACYTTKDLDEREKLRTLATELRTLANQKQLVAFKEAADKLKSLKDEICFKKIPPELSIIFLQNSNDPSTVDSDSKISGKCDSCTKRKIKDNSTQYEPKTRRANKRVYTAVESNTSSSDILFHRRISTSNLSKEKQESVCRIPLVYPESNTKLNPGRNVSSTNYDFKESNYNKSYQRLTDLCNTQNRDICNSGQENRNKKNHHTIREQKDRIVGQYNENSLQPVSKPTSPFQVPSFNVPRPKTASSLPLRHEHHKLSDDSVAIIPQINLPDRPEDVSQLFASQNTYTVMCNQTSSYDNKFLFDNYKVVMTSVSGEPFGTSECCIFYLLLMFVLECVHCIHSISICSISSQWSITDCTKHFRDNPWNSSGSEIQSHPTYGQRITPDHIPAIQNKRNNCYSRIQREKNDVKHSILPKRTEFANIINFENILHRNRLRNNEDKKSQTCNCDCHCSVKKAHKTKIYKEQRTQTMN